MWRWRTWAEGGSGDGSGAARAESFGGRTVGRRAGGFCLDGDEVGGVRLRSVSQKSCPERQRSSSYASQRRGSRQAIGVQRCAKPGVEVWFDQNELVGGDAWDAKIRKQILECALFVPVISATRARLEGFSGRVEARGAAHERDGGGEGVLLPVVIDATRDAEAKVPGEFRAVQWTRLPEGEATAAFLARVKSLLGRGRCCGPGRRRARLDRAHGEGRGPRGEEGRGRAMPLTSESAPCAGGRRCDFGVGGSGVVR